jgi:hypothetical protein
VKKLSNWQANNFSDLNFFFRGVLCVEFFSDFLTEFVGQKKVRHLGRAVPGSCGNFREKFKKKIEKVEKNRRI